MTSAFGGNVYPGYVPQLQLSKWFPDLYSAQMPAVDNVQPVNDTGFVEGPKSTADILQEINGGGEGSSRGGDITGGGPAGSLNGVGDIGAALNGFDPGRAPNMASLGIPGYMGSLGNFAMNAALPGLGTAFGAINSIGNIANTALNAQDLATMGYAMSPGQMIGGALGLNSYNGALDAAMNAAMANDQGRAALSGKGPSTADIDAMAASYAAAIEGDLSPADDPTGSPPGQTSMGTSPNAPVGGVESSALGNDTGNMGGDMGGGFGGGFAGGSGDVAGQGGFQGQRNGGRVGYAAGGALAPGSYIIPADVVSAFGNGSTNAGGHVIRRKYGGALVHGAGDGRSDSVPFQAGSRPVLLSDGEGVIPPSGVRRAGGAGALDREVVKTRKKYRDRMGAFGAPK